MILSGPPLDHNMSQIINIISPIFVNPKEWRYLTKQIGIYFSGFPNDIKSRQKVTLWNGCKHTFVLWSKLSWIADTFNYIYILLLCNQKLISGNVDHEGYVSRIKWTEIVQYFQCRLIFWDWLQGPVRIKCVPTSYSYIDMNNET